MSFVDIIILIPLGLAVFKGYRNGFIVELTMLVALFLGILAGIYFSDLVSEWLISSGGLNPAYTHAISFALIFIGVLILMRLLAKVVQKVAESLALGFFNRILGAAFGLLKAAFLISVILYLINQVDPRHSIIGEKTREKSVLMKPLAALAPALIPKMKSVAEKLNTKDLPDSLQSDNEADGGENANP